MEWQNHSHIYYNVMLRWLSATAISHDQYATKFCTNVIVRKMFCGYNFSPRFIIELIWPCDADVECEMQQQHCNSCVAIKLTKSRNTLFEGQLSASFFTHIWLAEKLEYRPILAGRKTNDYHSSRLHLQSTAYTVQ